MRKIIPDYATDNVCLSDVASNAIVAYRKASNNGIYVLRQWSMRDASWCFVGLKSVLAGLQGNDAHGDSRGVEGTREEAIKKHVETAGHETVFAFDNTNSFMDWALGGTDGSKDNG